jgi:hypothetical protein
LGFSRLLDRCCLPWRGAEPDWLLLNEVVRVGIDRASPALISLRFDFLRLRVQDGFNGAIVPQRLRSSALSQFGW